MKLQFPNKAWSVAALMCGAAWAHSAMAADRSPEPPLPSAATDRKVAADAEPSEVVVIGVGRTKQINTVPEDVVATRPQGTSPIALLRLLPGVSNGSVDPFGLDELSFDLTVRGFAAPQLGFTMDGVPLGDQTYGNYNGLGIARAIIPENIATTTLSEGIGSLGTASASNLGGAVEVHSSNPLPQFGARATTTFGTYDTGRAFLRMDTGDLNGLSAYLSGVMGHTEKWKGHGSQDERQLNFKSIYRKNKLTLTAYVDISDLDFDNYLIMTPTALARLGPEYDQFAPDFQHAVDTAKGIYYGGIQSFSDSQYDSRTLRQDQLGYVTAKYDLTDKVSISGTVYDHHDKGQGNSYTNSPSSSAAIPLAVRSTFYGIDRPGFIGRATAVVGFNSLEIGYWHEEDSLSVGRDFFYITGPKNIDTYLPRGDGTYFWQKQSIVTDMVYVQDRIRLLDGKLHIDVGAKSLNQSQDVKTPVGNYGAGRLKGGDDFLPTAGINYRFTDELEAFASWAKNVKAYPASTNSPFFQTPNAAGISLSVLKPESSRTAEVGLRYTTPKAQLVVTAYSVDFLNRIANIGVCPFQATCATVAANTGPIYSKGVEVTGNLFVTPSLTWRNTFSYNETNYLSNYTSNGVAVINTAGKTIVDTPNYLASTSLTFHRGAWLLSVDAKYTGKRFVTYTNDESVKSYTVVNMHAGYNFGDCFRLKDVTLSVDGTNIFNTRYVSSLYGVAPSDPNRTLSAYLIGAPAYALLSLSARY